MAEMLRCRVMVPCSKALDCQWHNPVCEHSAVQEVEEEEESEAGDNSTLASVSADT